MTEKIENILADVKNCQKCKTIIGYKKFPFASHGKTDSQFMLVSEAPGKESITEEKYWIGAGGKLLRSILEEANEELRGHKKDEKTETNKELEDIFYLTDIVKCWPNENNENRTPPYDSEIRNCSPFLKREIKALNPKLILSFGIPSSEYLLDKKVLMKNSHGQIYNYNESTKVLVMYHPSGIDRHKKHIKKENYARQLKELFKNIIENKLDQTEDIFIKLNADEAEHLENPQQEKETKNSNSMEFKGLSFILPTSGNKITNADISKNQLRVTAELKNHFPPSNTSLIFIHLGKEYKISFNYRVNKSYILRLGSTLMNLLNLTSSSSVKITKINSERFAIEKIQ